eukprot:5138985-Amphidinium_carterae.1
MAGMTIEQWHEVVNGWLPGGLGSHAQQLAAAMLVHRVAAAACYEWPTQQEGSEVGAERG